jgi:hypothetical protein
MHRDLENTYIQSCTEFQRNKNPTSKPTGPLRPLPVPNNRFDTITLDFIGPLPEEDGKDTILTITDPLGTNIHITSTHSSYTTAQIAVVLFDEWYQNFTLPHQSLRNPHSFLIFLIFPVHS